jgi:hypothetical protein
MSFVVFPGFISHEFDRPSRNKPARNKFFQFFLAGMNQHPPLRRGRCQEARGMSSQHAWRKKKQPGSIFVPRAHCQHFIFPIWGPGPRHVWIDAASRTLQLRFCGEGIGRPPASQRAERHEMPNQHRRARINTGARESTPARANQHVPVKTNLSPPPPSGLTTVPSMSVAIRFWKRRHPRGCEGPFEAGVRRRRTSVSTGPKVASCRCTAMWTADQSRLAVRNESTMRRSIETAACGPAGTR